MRQADIFALIERERARQDTKFGTPRKLTGAQWFTILGEEVGEIARGILERDPENLQEELVQVAAVCVAVLEQFNLMLEASNWHATEKDAAITPNVAALVQASSMMPRSSLTTDPNDPRLTHGLDEEPVYQAEVYLVLSEEERAKGFVRPVRRSYVHTACGSVTSMGTALAETYARNPAFYGATFCMACSKHRPVSEFTWYDTDQLVGS